MRQVCLSIAQRHLQLMELKLGPHQYQLMMTLLEMKAYEASLGDGSLNPIDIGKKFTFHIKLIETQTEAIFDMIYLGEAKDGRPRFFMTRFRWEAFKLAHPLEVVRPKVSSKKTPAPSDYNEIKKVVFFISATVATAAAIMANLSEIGDSIKNLLEIASTISRIAIAWLGKSD